MEKLDMNNSQNTIQNILLENRKKLSISGVTDVLNFDDKMVNLETDLGMLSVKGDDLKINKLSLDTTEVIIEGNISGVSYSDRQTRDSKDQSIFNRIFK